MLGRRNFRAAGSLGHEKRPNAATSSYRTGQSGVAAAKQERIKEGKYSEAAAAKGIRFTPFAMETYGKLGTKALRLLLVDSRADRKPSDGSWLPRAASGS